MRALPSRSVPPCLAAKGGRHERFPPTAPTPSTLRGAIRQVCGGGSVGDLCSRWGAQGAGLLAAAPPEAQAAWGGGGGQLLLTAKRPEHYDAYALEAAGLYPGAVVLERGAFALQGPAPWAALTRQAGLRAVVRPLVAAADAMALVRGVGALDVRLPLDVPVSMYHEKLSRCQRRMGSPALAEQLGVAMRPWGGDPGRARYGRVAQGAPSGTAEAMVRFAVVEMEWGYVFGLVEFAPEPPPEGADFSGKPHNYSAALPFPLASAAVSLAAGGGEGLVMDPCCGSGTVPFAAWQKGLGAAGGDVEPAMVQQAAANLAALRGSAEASRAARDRAMQRAGAGGGAQAGAGAGEGELPWLWHGDALEADLPSGCLAVVTNLPFGRMAAVGGGAQARGTGACYSRVGAGAHELRPLLDRLRPLANRHVFFAGVPIAEQLASAGYEGVREVALPKRRWLSVSGS